MTRRPVRVLLADDHAAIRAGLRLLLDAAPDVEVVGEAADGTAAVTNARALRPDVVLMDLRMPGVDGIEATRVITGEHLAEVLVLTTFDLDEYVDGALRAGAAGSSLKTAEPAALLDAVRRVADGDGVLAPRSPAGSSPRSRAAPCPTPAPAPRGIAPGRHGRSGNPAASGGGGVVADDRADPRLADLTPREVDVLAALGRGLSNQGIATDLYITEATAKTHVSRVLAKLGVATRMQAAIVARRRPGLTPPGHRPRDRGRRARGWERGRSGRGEVRALHDEGGVPGARPHRLLDARAAQVRVEEAREEAVAGAVRVDDVRHGLCRDLDEATVRGERDGAPRPVRADHETRTASTRAVMKPRQSSSRSPLRNTCVPASTQGRWNADSPS